MLIRETEAYMSMISRIFIGALGGLAAWLSKLLALDADALSQLVRHELWLQADEMKVSVFIILPVLVFLGALIAGLTDENLRLKLFAIGVSAPAIIAPWTAKSVLPGFAELEALGVTAAYAQTVDQRQQQRGIVDGVKILFGFTPIPRPEEQKYWVIASSHADLDEAFRAAAEINARDPELDAFVGNRMPDNPLYPVIVGGKDGYQSVDQAKLLQEQADKLGLTKQGSYLSSYAERFPEGGVPQ